LAGAAAGAGVIAAGVLMKAAPASAANGDAVILGNTSNTATSTTYIEKQGSGTSLIAATDGPGIGVTGVADFLGNTGGVGVLGLAPGGEGVYGDATNKIGLGAGTTVNGVHGVCDISGNGVWGESVDRGSGTGNGVYGSTNSAGASGVYGHNAGTGYGVAGRAESGTGTLGDSTNGVGVVASSQNGTGLSATTAFGTAASVIATAGTALNVNGPTVFSRSGLVTIKAPAKSASVTVAGGLATTSLALATLQNSIAGVSVASAVPNASTGKITINLNKAPPSTSPTAKVAWFVLG
jgi:hypothetical protein